ncbi:hypothetical protein JXB22_04790 [candidate division WOR-3 bacterium]|nr:hypothetical protein [candidate division WOR-3 bacterium]
MLEKKLVQEIRRSIQKKFPEYAKVKPSVTTARIEPQMSIFKKLSMGIPKRHITVYKMRFKKEITAEDKVILQKILTVTFNGKGDIIKITESK